MGNGETASNRLQNTTNKKNTNMGNTEHRFKHTATEQRQKH